MSVPRSISQDQRTITRQLACGCTFYHETLYERCAEAQRLRAVTAYYETRGQLGKAEHARTLRRKHFDGGAPQVAVAAAQEASNDG